MGSMVDSEARAALAAVPARTAAGRPMVISDGLFRLSAKSSVHW
jgi:hypothetical protein